jgi:hypothetical protein
MATVVLVHGIAQEQKTADGLEAEVWLPALAGGIREAGRPELADRIRGFDAANRIDVRMAFYGALYLERGAQGATGPNLADLPDDQVEMLEQLAASWLSNAADYADDPRDQATAEMYRRAAAAPPETAQGARAALRPTLDTLTKIRWFAPIGMGIASRFVWRALTQVTRYLNDETLRAKAQQRVLDLIDADTRLVISHSLGTVVAYEALHSTDQPTALITLGSPLALQNVIYQRLRPQPSCVPPAVTRWDNFVDNDDLVAAHTDLRPYFPPQPDSTVAPITAQGLNNGSQPHDAAHYLGKRAVGAAVSTTLEHESHLSPPQAEPDDLTPHS